MICTGMLVLFDFNWPRENHVVIVCEEDDRVGGHFYDLDFLDDAHLSSRTSKEASDSGRKLGLFSVLLVGVARYEGDVSVKRGGFG